ncbi:MAG TPA: DUF4342 domain-containing protein [Clostridiales bacterium]|nr:DUF4342 domain-containing protein [Clostridiales bacterium]
MEKIDELRKRINCSYEEAKILLEKYNGDLIEAIVDFEKRNVSQFRSKSGSNSVSFGTKIKQVVDKGFKTKFIIEKSGDKIINIPVNFFIIGLIIFNWFLVIALIISFVLGCIFKIRKQNGKEIDINNMVTGFGSKVKESTGDTKQNNNHNYSNNSIVKKNDDSNKDYNEYTNLIIK